jgi:hypothetical protein
MKTFIIRLVLGVLGEFLASAIRALTSKSTTDRIARLALTHVKLLNYSTLTNEEKRKAAFEGVKADAKQLGLDAKDWVVNAAIELAVGKLKAGGIV